jgi:hypothetical protein
MNEKVQAAAKAMAPSLEPVSWYNPKPEAEATAEVTAPTAESWTARMRNKLAATLLTK